MSTLEAVFGMASMLAFFSWIALFVFYPRKWIYRVLFSGVFILMAFTYLFYIVLGLSGGGEGGFGSLAEVRVLFESDKALLAGWIHYLVFDLFVGMWITKDASEKDINRWIILLSLILTFMLGPVGLLTYFFIRGIKIRKLNQSPFHS
jgi:hypothetical protein